METIKIKYFDNEIDKIEKISKSSWQLMILHFEIYSFVWLYYGRYLKSYRSAYLIY